MVGEVHRASEHISHARIDAGATQLAESIEQGIRIGPLEVGDPADAQVPQVPANAWADSRDPLQIVMRSTSHAGNVVGVPRGVHPRS